MTDTLRTRIAKFLHTRYGRDLGYADHEWDEIDQAAYLADADAVIRELGPLVRYWDKDFKELHYCRECGGWGPKDD